MIKTIKFYMKDAIGMIFTDGEKYYRTLKRDYFFRVLENREEFDGLSFENHKEFEVFLQSRTFEIDEKYLTPITKYHKVVSYDIPTL